MRNPGIFVRQKEKRSWLDTDRIISDSYRGIAERAPPSEKKPVDWLTKGGIVKSDDMGEVKPLTAGAIKTLTSG